MLTVKGVADVLGRSKAWFHAHKPELEAAGFPRRDELLGGWHEEAVRRWVIARSTGEAPISPALSPWVERARRVAEAGKRSPGQG